MIRLGNQTAFSAVSPLEPFDYALVSGFKAFEWFPDRGSQAIGGWTAADLDTSTRRWIRDTAREHDMRLSVHAHLDMARGPDWWQADFELAHDLGAKLLNVHLETAEGLEAFLAANLTLIGATAEAGLTLAFENTPFHSPEVFNAWFALLRAQPHLPTDHVGLGFDLGHANLCSATRNDYLGFVDRLEAKVPIVHLHLHENWGERDEHLPLFTGPAARDDSGLRGLFERLVRRGFSGAGILEQWPQPPTLLNQAHDKLLRLLEESGSSPLR